MSSDQIEAIAVNIVKRELLKYDNLKDNINLGDKEISWDGYITVFDGKGRGKNNFEYNINVQVKGRHVDKIKKGKNKFSLEKSHLINYQKQKNGTLLLVVDFIDIDNYQIYYANLLPVDLKELIDRNDSKAKKPKISIDLKPVIEASSSSLKNICVNFALNSKRQMGLQIKKLDELKNVAKIEFKVVSEKDKIEEYLLNNDIYTYAILDDDLKTEIALPKSNFVMIEKNIIGNIKIKDKTYYTSYKYSKQKDEEIIKIGNGIVLNMNDQKVIFDFKGSLEKRIEDMNFSIELLKNKTLSVNGTILNFPEEKNSKNGLNELIKNLNNKIEEFKMLNQEFIKMGIKFDEDIEKLDKKDRNNLLLFKRIFCDKQIPNDLKVKKYGINTIKIGKYCIAVLIEKDKNGKLSIYNYFEDLDKKATIVMANNKEKPDIKNRTSPYFVLNSDNIINFSNFNADIVLKSLSLIKNWKKQADYITIFMLQVLNAYDKDNKRKDILNLAEEINNQLLKKDNNIINVLNKFQILKRKRDLNEDEINSIIEMRNSMIKDDQFEKNQCGIAILLENKNDYDYYYKKLDKKAKKDFDTFPIKSLLK